MMNANHRLLQNLRKKSVLASGRSIRLVVAPETGEHFKLIDTTFSDLLIDCAHSAGVFSRRKAKEVRSDGEVLEVLEKNGAGASAQVLGMIRLSQRGDLFVEVSLNGHVSTHGDSVSERESGGEEELKRRMSACLDFARRCYDHLDPYRRSNEFLYSWKLALGGKPTVSRGVVPLNAGLEAPGMKPLSLQKEPRAISRRDFTFKKAVLERDLLRLSI